MRNELLHVHKSFFSAFRKYLMPADKVPVKSLDKSQKIP